MGLNTSVLIKNDALHEIAEDKDFGSKIQQAVQRVFEKPIQITSGKISNAAIVVETHHSDDISVVAFGGGKAQQLGSLIRNESDKPEEILRALAATMGYRLVKKTKK